MELRGTIKNKKGQDSDFIYRDIGTFEDIRGLKITGARAYCFYNGKLVIVYEDTKGHWSIPGGGIEDGEDVQEGIRREVREESNMNVIRMKPLGCLEVKWPEGLARYVWAVCTVEPLGIFSADPGGEVTEMKLIDFSEWPGEYFKSDIPEMHRRIDLLAAEALKSLV